MFLSTFLFLAITLYLSLASVGHRFFIHQFYVKKLLQLFEYGSKRVKTVQKRLHATRERKRKLSMIKERTPQLTIDTDDDEAFGNAVANVDDKDKDDDDSSSEEADESKFNLVT